MWIEAIVMPREYSRPVRAAPGRRRGAQASRASAPSPAPSRKSLYEAGCEESLKFRDAVLGFLQTHQLMSAVRWVSEPGSIPQVTLHCTLPVLEQLRQVPEFEAGMSMSLELLT